MGKYPPSRLNQKYSDWHWKDNRFRRDDFLTDIDTIWVEVRGDKPIAAFDLKEPGASITWAESKVYNWLEVNGLPVFVVKTDMTFEKFRIERWKTQAVKTFSQSEYINFINNLQQSLF